VTGGKLVSPFPDGNKTAEYEMAPFAFFIKKKAKTMPSAGKVMGTVFWDAEGCILAIFLEPRQTINAARYVQTLHKLRRALHERLG
jgi:hypothetical protein